MFAIKFDGIFFTNLETLSAYIAGAYGSWSQVPEDHPQHELVHSLAILNPSYYEDREGVAVDRPLSEWPVYDGVADYDEIDDHDEWPELDYCSQYAACQPWRVETGVCPDCPHL
jgi:hypothetical protein